MPKIRLFNPARRRKRRASSKKKRVVRKKKTLRRKKNLQGGTLTFMANTHKKRSRRRKKNSRRRRRNPVLFARKGARRSSVRRRRRNPFGITWTGIGMQTTAAIVTGVATRSVPQALLGAKNSGIVGYAANAVTAAICTFAANKIQPGLGNAALLGGATMIAGRLAEEFIGKKLLEYAEVPIPVPHLSGDGRYALAGDFRDASFLVPTSSLPGGVKKICPPCPPVAARGTGVGLWKGAWKN